MQLYRFQVSWCSRESESISFQTRRTSTASSPLLQDHLERQGCHTEQATADADLIIVQTAIAASENVSNPTVLVEEDTDLLDLLCFHIKNTSRNIYFRPEPKHGAKHPPKCWNIALHKTTIRPEVCNSVLFMHAILGCDTTSGI